MSPIASTIEIMQTNELVYQRAFDELGTIEKCLDPEIQEQSVKEATPSLLTN